MRTFRGNAPIIIGASALVLSLLALAPSPLQAQDEAQLPSQTVAAPGATAMTGPTPTLAELRSKLDASDRTIALQALELALSELGDGTTLMWKRPTRQLAGAVRPTSVFRDDSGRICRHVLYALTLGPYSKQVEGIACRDAAGHWSLEG
jgi:surface antigen